MKHKSRGAKPARRAPNDRRVSGSPRRKRPDRRKSAARRARRREISAISIICGFLAAIIVVLAIYIANWYATRARILGDASRYQSMYQPAPITAATATPSPAPTQAATPTATQAPTAAPAPTATQAPTAAPTPTATQPPATAPRPTIAQTPTAPTATASTAAPAMTSAPISATTMTRALAAASSADPSPASIPVATGMPTAPVRAGASLPPVSAPVLVTTAAPTPTATSEPTSMTTPEPTPEPTPTPDPTPTPSPEPTPVEMPVAVDVPIPTANADTLVFALPTAPPVQDSFSELLALNPDTVGYLEIEGLISLPVVQRENDNDHYLDYNFDGEQSREGALFLDGVNRLVPEDDCLIVYGHNMRNGTMFGSLDRFARLKFLKAHPIVRFDTLYENRLYVPFAAFAASMNPKDRHYFDVRQFLFDPTGFELFTQEMQSRSARKIPVDVRYGDGLLLLVTCDYTRNQGRFILGLRQLRPGETEADMQKLFEGVK